MRRMKIGLLALAVLLGGLVLVETAEAGGFFFRARRNIAFRQDLRFQRSFVRSSPVFRDQVFFSRQPQFFLRAPGVRLEIRRQPRLVQDQFGNLFLID